MSNDEITNSQIKFFVDEINTLNAYLFRLNNDELIFNCREKLDQWRENSIILINQIYENKFQELNRRCTKRIDSFKLDIDQIRCQLSKYLPEQSINSDEFDILKLNITDLKRRISQIKDKSFQISFQPLQFNENLITIEEPKIFDLNLLKLPKAYRILNTTKQSWPTMISNEQILLIDHYPHLISLNQDLQIIKQILWTNGFIRNMCWSTTLNNFILINNEKDVFLINQHSLASERIKTIENEYWWSCTCSNNCLFLTNTTMGTNIFQYNLLLSFQLIKRWKPPYSCDKHEYIDDINNQNQLLALVIKVPSKSIVFFELRSLKTFERIWKIQLDIKKNWFQQTIRCSSIKSDEWIVIEGNTSHIFHILQNGKIQTIQDYQPSPINAVLFGSKILVIRTKEKIFFHRI